MKSSLKKIKSSIENINKSKKKILVDCYPNSLVYLYALLIHTFPTQIFFNSNCIIYCSNFSFTKSYLLSSLKNYEVFYLDSFIRNIFIILKNLKILKAEFIKIQSIEKNQFDYKFDGIEFGKIGYDNYLRKQKYGKLRNLSIYKHHVLMSVLYYLNVKKLIENNISIYSGKEKQFLPRAVVLQTCLKNSIKSYMVWGPHDRFSVRKYACYSQRYFSLNHINKHDFIQRMNNKSLEKGNKYIDDKFHLNQINKGDTQTNLAFNDNLKKMSKKSFLKILELDGRKKTAIVFSHCNFDGIHGSPRRMYDDFYVWLEKTILILAKNDKINVLIKPHPTDGHFGATNMCEEIYKKHNLKQNKHIKLLNNEFHPSTLLKVLDFNITANGTVGAEYGAFNIPCISTDYAPYNYCSFNHNFKDKNNYSKQLMELPKLFNNENSKNKIDAYHFLNLSFNETKLKNPYFTGSDTDVPKNYSINEESKYLKRCINFVEKSDYEDKKFFYESYKNYFKDNSYTMFKKY